MAPQELKKQQEFCINHSEHFKGTYEEMIAYVRKNYEYDGFCCVYDIEDGHDWGEGPDDIFETE